eukprot:Pgem_evm1s3056
MPTLPPPESRSGSFRFPENVPARPYKNPNLKIQESSDTENSDNNNTTSFSLPSKLPPPLSGTRESFDCDPIVSHSARTTQNNFTLPRTLPPPLSTNSSAKEKDADFSMPKLPPPASRNVTQTATQGP